MPHSSSKRFSGRWNHIAGRLQRAERCEALLSNATVLLEELGHQAIEESKLVGVDAVLAKQ